MPKTVPKTPVKKTTKSSLSPKTKRPKTLSMQTMQKSDSFGKTVCYLRELFGFTKKDFADVLNVNEKTIRRWEMGLTEVMPHTSHKKAIMTLQTVAESLSDLFEPDMIKVWVDRPNPALQGERPRDYARKPGGIFIMANLLGAVGR